MRHFEPVHLPEHDPEYNMPYTPAIKVRGGRLVFVAGVTAAPVYHSHPHVPQEFAGIPLDPGAQTQMALHNLQRVLQAAGGDLQDIVQVFRFIKDLDRNQDAVNVAMGQRFGAHRPASTTVEIVRLATDARLVVELAAVAVVPDEPPEAKLKHAHRFRGRLAAQARARAPRRPRSARARVSRGRQRGE
jgi:enamine deaminase RidA (YjgF/YER057c/UK114 family)